MCVWGGVAVGRASDSFPVSHEFESYQRLPLFPLGKTINPHYLVLVYSRNGFNRDLHKQNCMFHNRIKVKHYKLYYERSIHVVAIYLS